MEVKEILDVLDPKMKEYKEQVAEVAKKANEKLEADVKNLNEDLSKTGATLAEIKQAVDEMKAKAGRMGAIKEAQEDFTSLVSKSIAENFNEIKEVRKGNSVQFKAVGDMTASANLTGSVVAGYSLTPSLRGRRKVHFRDIPGVQVIPSATGVWKYYLNNSTPGEGSFGNQTIGSAKAQIDYDFTETTVTVSTLAGFSRVAKQMLRDLPFLQNFLPGELQEDYLRAEDNSFINSLMAGTASSSLSASVLAEKYIEAIGTVMGRDYDPTAIVTTAGNWTTLMNTKPADYSLPGGGSMTIDGSGAVNIAGVPVVVQNGMTSGKSFVGDFSRVKIIQANQLSIQFFEQDADNVTKNLITVRAEADVALAVLRSDWGLYF
jgi:HK97 family phage major capsid protein